MKSSPAPSPPLMNSRLPPFRIKICGVTTSDDATAAIAAGADAIGLNFFPQSSRFVEPAAAREIARSTAGMAVRAGVFVNADPSFVAQTVESLGLEAIQLHGDEPVSDHVQLSRRPLVRALRVDAKNAHATAELFQRLREAGASLAGVLVDARHGDAYGGTGTMADWSAAAWLRDQLGETPMILAGGLTPENVAAAIRSVRPAGVDVASGVESSPGVKDQPKVAAFVAAAREAFLEIAAAEPG